MHDIMPKNESLKRAVRWISENLKLDPNSKLQDLITEAVFKYDLTPKDSYYLYDFYSSEKK